MKPIHREKINRTLPPSLTFLAAAALAFFTLVSCSSTPSRDRGSLSDAMDKARDDHEGSRSVPDERRDDDSSVWWFVEDSRDDDDDDYVRESGGSAGTYVSDPIVYGYASEKVSFGFRGAFDLTSSEPWSAPFDGDLLLAISGQDSAALVYGGLRIMEPGAATPFAASIKDTAGIFRLGLQIRWYPFPGDAYLRPYVDVGGGGFSMGWTYRNALTAGEETISGDSLGGLHLAVGAGVSLARWERAEFSVRIVPEVYLFGDTTGEGFTNDFFSPLGVVKLEGELLFR